MRVVRQLDAMQCGVACLATICGIYGHKYSIQQLSNYCFASHQGVSFSGIADGARAVGLIPTAVKCNIGALQTINHPYILHWDNKHFVVLYKVSRKGLRFHIADPAQGKYTCSVEDLRKHWLNSNGIGLAMKVEPGPDFGKCLNEDVEDRRSFKLLFQYLKAYRHHFVQIFCGLVLGCIFQLAMPFLTQSIVDKGIGTADIPFICLVLLGQLMIVFGKTATDFVRRWLLLHISMRVNISLVNDFFIKLLRLPMSYFDVKMTGDLLQRMSDHARVETFLSRQTLNVVFNLLSFVVFGAVLWIYDSFIFLIFLAGICIYVLWVCLYLNARKRIDYENFETQARRQNKTYQFLTTIQEIKLQDCEQRRRWEWEDVQADVFEVQLKSLKVQQKQEAGAICINEIKNIIITVFAATAVINGHLTLGGMLAIQYIIGQLNSPVEQLVSFIYTLQDVRLSLERINEIHNREVEICDTAKENSYVSDDGISIKKLDFRYDPHCHHKTLENVSFNAPKGKFTAIVGASGSGKTTIMKLLLGYYNFENGEIKIGGRDIGDYNLKWWRSRCGVVMQDGVIFSESIARNIAVGDAPIDYEAMENAAKIANISAFVESLPLKYNTIIGADGMGLSQGQKQRILIARAVYKNPDYIFLDEATNALDAENESIIVRNLEEFYRGRTVIVVAHRLSTVRNADVIVVLDKGQVVETGTHQELVNRNGAYVKLISNQLDLGK